MPSRLSPPPSGLSMRLPRWTSLVIAATCPLPGLAQEATLPAVVITGERDADLPRTSSSGTRTETPIEHIPQSVIVLPRSVIDNQGSRSVSEALRNVSNVNNVDPRDSNNVGFKIRGFPAAMVVDGVALPGYFPNQERLVNVERIDVLKGPAGNLFGSVQSVGSYATLGGTIALTTSEPHQKAARQLGLSLGSYGHRGLSLDVNQPISPALAARVIGEIGREDSESDAVFFKRRAFFPSLAWTPDADTSVVVRMRYLHSSTLDYSGLTPSGTIDTTSYTLPRSLTVTAQNLPDTTQTSQGVNLQWNQRLDQTWNFSMIAAYNEARIDQRGVFPFPFGGAGPLHLLAGARLWDKWKTSTLSPSLTGIFQGETVKQTVSLGMDVERTKDDAYMAFSNGTGLLDFTQVDLRNPSFPAWVEPVAPAVPDQQNRYRSTVLYVQDQVDLGSWHLLGSLRQSRITVTDVNPAFGVDNRSTNSKLTPRAGLVYDLHPSLSLFAGYSEGMKVPTGSIFATAPKPEESRQTELGLRVKAWSGLTATAALFDLTRRNAAVADPANPGFSVQTGKQRSKGLDLDARWEMTPQWTTLMAFTSQKARIVEDGNPALVDKQLFNVPQKTARLATRYELREGAWRGLGLGVGATRHASLPGDSTNTFFTPAATVFDAQASYKTASVRYGLGVTNLTDKTYYTPSAYFAGGQVTPAPRRTFVASAMLNF